MYQGLMTSQKVEHPFDRLRVSGQLIDLTLVPSLSKCAPLIFGERPKVEANQIIFIEAISALHLTHGLNSKFYAQFF
jgi:hypothetical protein